MKVPEDVYIQVTNLVRARNILTLLREISDTEEIPHLDRMHVMGRVEYWVQDTEKLVYGTTSDHLLT